MIVIEERKLWERLIKLINDVLLWLVRWVQPRRR